MIVIFDPEDFWMRCGRSLRKTKQVEDGYDVMQYMSDHFNMSFSRRDWLWVVEALLFYLFHFYNCFSHFFHLFTFFFYFFVKLWLFLSCLLHYLSIFSMFFFVKRH